MSVRLQTVHEEPERNTALEELRALRRQGLLSEGTEAALDMLEDLSARLWAIPSKDEQVQHSCPARRAQRSGLRRIR
jgi:hypothetical protein